MARLRTNNVFGTTLNNPLAAGGTSLSGAGLANLVAVTGSDYAAITLDPNRVHGAPEIVYVTAHTAAATVATILRGQEGTAARSHPVGTFWVHGATALDFIADAAWTAFTPTLTQSGAVTKTATYARYTRVGRTIHAQVDLTVTGSGTASNQIVIGLPVAAASGAVMVGAGLVYDTSTALVYNAIVEIMAGGAGVALRPTTSTVNGNLGAVAFTAALASGDIVRYGATYEAAS